MSWVHGAYLEKMALEWGKYGNIWENMGMVWRYHNSYNI